MSRRTVDFDDLHYSPEVIRELEDPEYARAAEEYEREARREKLRSRRSDKHGARKSAVKHGRRRSSRRAEEPPRKPKKQKKRRMKKAVVFRNIVVIILLLLVILMGYLLHLTSNLDKVDTKKSDFAITEEAADSLKGYRNILILGSDARKDEGYDGSRTDAIIILSINRKNGDTRMISVMRDSYVKMDDSNGNLILDKLTHAHAFGGGANACAALNRTLDLNIQEFVIFNWQAVSDAVNTLGGVEIDVKENEIRDLNKWGPETGENVGQEYVPITETGVQTLSGAQATTYCRIRKTSGGDTGRGQRYKKVMAAVMKKALTNPGKMKDLSRDVMPEIRTNMNKVQLGTFMARAPFLEMGKGLSWPKRYYGGMVGSGWYAVPQTLEDNVRWLRKHAFDQPGYQVSGTCSKINDEIIYDTGVQ